MKCIVLAAGYATRLWPLTKNKPKGLLEVGGKPMMEYALDKVLELNNIDTIYIITNNKFYKNFKRWAKNYNCKIPVKVINDKTMSNDDRLGAIGDLNYVLKNANVKDDFLVINSDNIYQFSLKPVYNYFQKLNKNVITILDVGSKEKAKEGLVVQLGENNKVINCVEKPENPKTTLYSMTIFFFPNKTRKRVNQYLKEGNDPDAPGHFPEWLHTKEDIYAYQVKGNTIDIGTPKGLEEAREMLI